MAYDTLAVPIGYSYYDPFTATIRVAQSQEVWATVESSATKVYAITTPDTKSWETYTLSSGRVIISAAGKVPVGYRYRIAALITYMLNNLAV